MSGDKYAKQDEQLFYHVKRLQQGYADSYTEVYNLSAKYLYKIIYDIVQDYHTTEDMLQEVFLKIYNNISSLQSPEAYFVWAGRIATNLCIRYLHKYRKETLSTVIDDGEGNEEFIFDRAVNDNEMFIPESVLENQEHQRLIGGVIDGLSVEQKLAVQCFYFEEMSVKEIAQLCQCSEGTIKSRLNYARKAIKEEVLKIEKTQGTKLYSLGAIPVLLLLYRGYAWATVGSIGTAATATAGANSVVGSSAMAGTKVTVSAAAGVSGKVVALVASIVIAIGGITAGGIVIGTSNCGGNDNEITSGYDNEDISEEVDNEERYEIVSGEVIPEGGRYEKITGEILLEGDVMPEKAIYGDKYFYEDYRYIAYDEGWKVERNDIEDYQDRTVFSDILERVADKNIIDISDLFLNCTSLEVAPRIPSGVKEMAAAFFDCKKIEIAPVLPDGVVNIRYAFSGCESLIEAPKIPDSVRDMESTFSSCSSLIEAPYIPEGVTCLDYTFMYCSSLERAINIPSTVEILDSTFVWCSNLVEPPTIANGVTALYGIFSNCERLTVAPEIPDSVTIISGMFFECKNLEEAPIVPASVYDMSMAFYSCISLTGNVVIDANPTEYSDCFYGVDFEGQNLKIKGKSSMIDELKTTGKNN